MTVVTPDPALRPAPGRAVPDPAPGRAVPDPAPGRAVPDPAAARPAGGAARPDVIKFHAPEIVFGLGSLAEAGFAARRLGAEHPFVVTDPGVAEAGWPAQLDQQLAEAGLKATVWSDVTPNPKDHEIAAGFARYADSGCDVIIAIGGGSPMDAAKGIAILTGNDGAILDYRGIDRVTKPIPPLLMVPSTAGTGADVSQFCIVTDTAAAVKVTIMGRALVPDISLTDPALLATMPADLAAATGLDALTHGIEAFTSLANNRLADGHALSAVRLVFANLPRMTSPFAGAECVVEMAQASLEAGMAFTNALLGATHALSHQVGGLLDLPHGVCNGVLLPHVIRFNAGSVGTRFVPLARAAGLSLPDGLPAAEAGLMLADKVQAMAAELGVPRGLGQLGVAEDDVPALAASAMNDACLATNPRAATEADLAALLRAAL